MNETNRMKKTLEELTIIPAPSFGENDRAMYCVKWLQENGVDGAYIDQYGNVIVTYPKLENPKSIINNYSCLLMAHLDTVFDDTVKLEIKKEQNIWKCPGIGDNTANVVVLMELIRYLYQEKPEMEKPLLFALDTGEEGLGNLAGCRGLMKDFEGHINKVVSFDLYNTDVYVNCVGSCRYEIRVKTAGGHSWLDFGNKNAIVLMAEIINDLYCYNPQGFEKTSFNVGTIQGGTSVNTIAQSGSFLFEFRSESAVSLQQGDEYLKGVLEKYREKYKEDNVDIECMVVGERPCSSVNMDQQYKMAIAIRNITESTIGIKPSFSSASTDCNIPLSQGVPAVCIGLVEGGGAHTLDEWVNVNSLEAGLLMAIRIVEFVKM